MPAAETKKEPLLSMPRHMRWIISIAIFFLVLMTLGRLVLFAYDSFHQNTFSKPLHVLWLGARYDFREVGILAVFILLLGSIKVFRPFSSNFARRFWYTLLSVLSFVLVILYVIDFMHYDYLSQRLNASALNFLQDASTSSGMVWQTYPVIKILFLIIVLSLSIIAFIKWRYRKVSQRMPVYNKRSAWFWGVLLFLLFGIGVFGRLGQYPLRWSDAFTMGNARSSQLALNPFQSFFSSLHFRYSSYDTKEVRKYYNEMADYLGVVNKDSVKLNFERDITPAAVDTERPNIVLVICESFSAYKSSMWGNPLNPTPFFDSLTQRGIFFNHCFTPHFGTARGVWATITGIPDVLLDKSASRNPLIVDQHSIMNDFKGYEKYYFIGGSTSWANIRGVLDNNIQGLHLYEQDNYDAPKVDVWGISDKNLFFQANKVLKKEDKPFFAIIQTSDNHRPYTIPKEDRAEFKRVNYPTDTLNKYGFQKEDELNAFRYTDFCFRKFIDTAKKEKYFRKTIFVFIGDHGIRGDAADMFPRAWTDNGLTCFHVPLLFYSPGRLAPILHTMNCSQVDVMPTIAGLVSMPYRNTTLGRDLLHLKDTTSNVSFVIDHDIRQVGVIQGDYYFMRQLVSGKENMVSIRNNDPVPNDPQTQQIRAHLQSLTNAFYETAKYMLFHNHK